MDISAPKVPRQVADAGVAEALEKTKRAVEELMHLVDGDKKLKLHCELMMDALKQPHGTHRAQPAQRAASLHNTPSADGGGSGGGGGLNKAKKQAKEPPLSLLLLRKYELDAMVKQGKLDADAANLTAGYFGGNGKAAICGWFMTSALFLVLMMVLLWFQPIQKNLWEVGAVICALESFIFFARAVFLLMPGWYRSAHRALIASFVTSAVLWAVYLPMNAGNLLDREYNWTNVVAPAGTPGVRPVSFVIVQTWFCLLGGLCLVIAMALFYQHMRHSQTSFMVFLGACTLTSLTIGVLLSLHPYYVPDGKLKQHIYQFFLAFSCVPFGVLVFMFMTRHWIVQNAKTLIQEDEKKYDEWWQSKKPYYMDAADLIQGFAERFKTAWEKRMKLKNKHMKENINWSSVENSLTLNGEQEQQPLLEDGAVGKLDRHDKLKEEFWFARKTAVENKFRQRIGDVSVLFAQAHTLQPIFQGKCEDWAAGIEGVECAKEVPIKRRARAIQKLFRTYQGNAGYLIDLVRSQICFEDDAGYPGPGKKNALDKLFDCLKRIIGDADVVVLNIKNRFGEDKVSDCCGYRNVSLSLILDADDAAEHGVDGHICELQLLVKTMKEVVNDFGHARYVRWRDLQAM